jgi:hypothetical protein
MMSMQHRPILLGLLTVGAGLSLTTLLLRLLGLLREEAIYLAVLTVTAILYFAGQRWQRRR